MQDLSELKQLGIDHTAHVTTWRDAAELLAAFEAIGRSGSNALVKVDGERASQVYTVVVSGGRPGKEFFHRDGDDLTALLREALTFFLEAVEPRDQDRSRPRPRVRTTQVAKLGYPDQDAARADACARIASYSCGSCAQNIATSA